MALDGQSLGSILCPCRETGAQPQPHSSYVGGRHWTMSESKVGQRGVKATGEVEGRDQLPAQCHLADGFK